MTLLRLFGSTLFELAGVLMLMPTLTVRLAGQGTPGWLIGLLASSLYLSIFAITPFATRFTRRYGLRAVYVATGGVPLLAALVLLATTALPLWWLAVVLLGLAGGLRWVCAEAYVASAAPRERRGAVIGAFQTMVGGCFVLGPALLVLTGTGGTRPLWLSAGLLATGLLCLIGLPDLPGVRDEASPHAFRRLLFEQPALVLAACLGGLFESGPSTFLPVVALGLGFPERAAAGLVAALGIGGFLVQLPLGALADAQPLGRLMRGCLLVALLGALLLAGSRWWSFLLWPTALLWGAAGGGIYTFAMVAVGKAWEGMTLIGATAVLVCAFSAGATLGPALIGAASWALPGYGFSGLMALFGVLGLGVIRQRGFSVRADGG